MIVELCDSSRVDTCPPKLHLMVLKVVYEFEDWVPDSLIAARLRMDHTDCQILLSHWHVKGVVYYRQTTTNGILAYKRRSPVFPFNH